MLCLLKIKNYPHFGKEKRPMEATLKGTSYRPSFRGRSEISFIQFWSQTKSGSGFCFFLCMKKNSIQEIIYQNYNEEVILLMQLNNSTKLIFFGPKRRLSDILWNQDELLLVSSLTKSAYDWNLTRATFFFCCKTNFYQVSSFKDRFFRLPLHLKPRNSAEIIDGQVPKPPSKNLNTYWTLKKASSVAVQNLLKFDYCR